MILKLIPPSHADSAVHRLPEPNMAVDPRPIIIFPHCQYEGFAGYKFKVTVNGTVLAITRIDREIGEDPGWTEPVGFRVYCRNEFHYSFKSTKYVYHGLCREHAPFDATEIIVKDGVERIKQGAFFQCRSLSKITIPNTVTRIEQYAAFGGCTSLRYIRLPPKLQYIGVGTFNTCLSLEAVFLPPTVTEIGSYAFNGCKSLRIINIPDRVRNFSHYIIEGCGELLSDAVNGFKDLTHNRQCLEWLIRNRYNSLHNLCWDPFVTVNNIQNHIQKSNHNEERSRTKDKPQFTALHLLAANPSVTSQMITAYLQLAPDVAIMQDNIGETPLHLLCSVSCFSDDSGGAIRAYLTSEEGRHAAFMKDDEGRTPFDRLCEKGFDEMLFLMNKSFGGMMVWWYDCLGITFFAEDRN